MQPDPDSVTLLENDGEADRNRPLDPVDDGVCDRVGGNPCTIPRRGNVLRNPLEARALGFSKVASELAPNLSPSDPALVSAGADQDHGRNRRRTTP